MKNISDILDSIIHTFYYYVPPCPNCESFVTGRYIKMHRENDSEWQINESLRHGEIVQPLDEVTERNCFCSICGYEWKDDIEIKFISRKELKVEKQKRSTANILNQRMHELRDIRKHDHSPFKHIKRYIGKI